MKFTQDKCPECGTAPSGIVDMVSGVSGLYYDHEESQFEYVGRPDIDWHSREPMLANGQVELICSYCKNAWNTEMES